MGDQAPKPSWRPRGVHSDRSCTLWRGSMEFPSQDWHLRSYSGDFRLCCAEKVVFWPNVMTESFVLVNRSRRLA